MSTPLAINSIDEAKSLINQQVGVSDWVTITQQMIETFAGVSEDYQWIHVDPVRAKAESPFGAPIAHGFLTLSKLTQLATSGTEVKLGAKTLINYGFNKIRFVSPVVSGSRIRGHFTLGGVKEIEGGYELSWIVTVEVEGGTKPAVVAEWLCRGYY
jgi:acyl dehydratase